MKHAIYSQVLFCEAVIEALLSSAGVVFAPGLFAVLTAASPPALAYFKSLPKHTYKIWGVYIIIMEKAGCKSRGYCGSGTAWLRGLITRWEDYDNGDMLPVYVQKSLDEGYSITSKGLLCWAPIPSAVMVPVIRVLFVALEAVFTFVFWMVNTKKTYSAAIWRICPWSQDTLEWDGLCSHSSLVELPRQNIPGLTPAAKQSIDKETVTRSLEWVTAYRVRQNRYKRESRARAKAADPIAYAQAAIDQQARFFSTIEDPRAYQNAVVSKSRAKSKAKDPHAYAQKARDTQKGFRAKQEDATGYGRAISQRCAAKAKAEGTYRCIACNLTFSRKPGLTRHNGRATHIAQVSKLARQA